LILHNLAAEKAQLNKKKKDITSPCHNKTFDKKIGLVTPNIGLKSFM
jgi:hypothetical protein